MIACHSIKEILGSYFASQISVQKIEDSCVVSLPWKTLDDRWADVFVEPRGPDFYLINDGGKTVNELILQGMKITPLIEDHLGSFAARFGVAFTDEAFQVGTKLPNIAKAIAAIGMCSTLAMTEILEYSPSVSVDSLDEQVGAILKRWSRRKARVEKKARVNGTLKQHVFDFVIHSRNSRPVAVSILNPTAGALSAAERYGFKTQDIAGESPGEWRNIAVETKAETWSSEARKIVERCADGVISIDSGEQATYELVSATLNALAA